MVLEIPDIWLVVRTLYRTRCPWVKCMRSAEAGPDGRAPPSEDAAPASARVLRPLDCAQPVGGWTECAITTAASSELPKIVAVDNLVGCAAIVARGVGVVVVVVVDVDVGWGFMCSTGLYGEFGRTYHGISSN